MLLELNGLPCFSSIEGSHFRNTGSVLNLPVATSATWSLAQRLCKSKSLASFPLYPPSNADSERAAPSGTQLDASKGLSVANAKPQPVAHERQLRNDVGGIGQRFGHGTRQALA